MSNVPTVAYCMGEKRGTVLTLLLINLQYVTVHVTEENTFIFAKTFKNVLYSILYKFDHKSRQR